MKGIYLTEEGKKEIEAEINQIESAAGGLFAGDESSFLQGRIVSLRDILASATILPVEESWEIAHDKVINYLIAELEKEETDNNTKSLNNFCESNWFNGVIIKPKE